MSTIEQYIRQAAEMRGIDPDIAVKVANSEGGLKDPFRRAGYVKNGFQEPSHGPFQLLIGGEGTGFPTGMGNDALAAGIDPRTNWQGGIDFALDGAAKNGWGAWYGAAKAGIGNRDGIGGARALGTSLTSLPADGPKGQEMYPRMAPPLPPPTTIADRPIGDPMPAKFDAGDSGGLMAMLKGLGSNEGAMGGLEGMMGAMGGGGESSAPQIQPSSVGPAVSNEIAAKAASAQQMMAALMASKRRQPGMSLMGMA